MPEPAWGSLPFDEQIEFFRGKLDLPSETWDEVWQDQHARAFVVAGATRDSLVKDFRLAVDKAIAQGTTLREFRRDFDDIVGRHGWSYNGSRGWRSRVIYETNLRTSYHAGRYKQQAAIAERRPYLRYKHSDASENPRRQHVSWDGLVLRIDDPFWETHYPPNGWGCKCYTESLSQRDLERAGKSGPDEPPEVEWREAEVGPEGAERTVRVPDGIDPGWGYNVGEAAWGRAKTERLVQRLGGEDWEVLSPGDWRSHDRPEELPREATSRTVGRKVSTELEAIDAVRAAIGAETRVFRVDTGDWRYPVHVDARQLGREMERDQVPWLPWLPDILENPAEVWARFERGTTSGVVALRLAFVRSVEATGGDLAFRALVEQGRLIGWALEATSDIQKHRRGRLLFARDD